MRNAFCEYYRLSKDEYDKLWNHGVVVFDTNVLLSLYRLQTDARNDMLAAMNVFKDRIWMPFQVGYEYHERRLEEAFKPVDSLKSLKERIDKFASGIESDYGKNPYIKDYKSMARVLKTLKDKISKSSEEWLKDCPDFKREDAILDQLTALYEDKVGPAYTEEQLTSIYKDGEVRYSNKIPPGYKDTGKKTGDQHRFGDLIIWLQILEKSKSSDCDIIFVTDDKKEDWWQMYNQDKIGPRRELVIEFRKATGNHLIGFYTPDRFLSVANDRKAVKVKKNTIEEVKYSDIVGVGLDGLQGESYQPGQVSRGVFSSALAGTFDESLPIAFSPLSKSDSGNINLTGTFPSSAGTDDLIGSSLSQRKLGRRIKLATAKPLDAEDETQVESRTKGENSSEQSEETNNGDK